jgi:apolipoprotein N-acyltransferase
MADPTRQLNWQAWQRVALGLALAVLSAAALTLAFPPYDVWPLIFVGLVPMILAQHRIMPPRLASLAYGVAIGGFFAGYFGPMFAGGPWFMRALPLLIALFAGLVSAADRAFHRRTRYRWLVLHGAAIWVGIEMIRGLIPTVGTWGFAAYALYGQPWLIQPVSVFSVYGLSLLILLVNQALGLGALALLDRRWRFDVRARPVPRPRARRWLATVGLLLAIWIGVSVALLSSFPDSAKEIRVAAVQPAFCVESDEGVRRLFDLTRQAADRGAELVVWHEGALPFDPQASRTEELRALAAETGAHLVIGYAFEADAGHRKEAGHRNEAVILTPDGRFLGPFGKDHPVAWSGETSVTSGPHAAYETDLGRLGMIICYDLDFTDTARRVTRAGAQLIAVPSFDWPAIAAKHYTHLVFRAVENRVAAVKADVAFDSAIIGPSGRVVARAVSPGAEQAVLVADVPLGSGQSAVVRLGDWVGWLALAGMAAFAVLTVGSALRSEVE